MGEGRRGRSPGRCRSRVANHAPGGWLPFLVAGSAGVGGARRGAYPAGRRLTLPFRNLLGGLPFWSPANPALSFLSCPHPPSPLPGGKGENQGYFMQGAPPLASPRLSRRRHGLNLRCRCPLGGLPGRSPADVAVPESVGGGLLSLSPAYPAFSLIFCPHPPDPLPLRGRGRFLVFLCKGLRPLHPRGLNPWFAAKPTGSGSLRAVPAAKERGDRGRWNYPSHATAAFEMVLSPGAGRTSAAVAPSIKIREKFWGVWGDSFKSPPAFLPSPSVSPFPLPPQPCFYLPIDNKEKKS